MKLLAGVKITSQAIAQDGRFSIMMGDDEISVRVSLIPGAYGESIVMRILNPKSIRVKLEDMGIEKKMYELFMEEIKKPNGLILLTGPTGSGKSTTLQVVISDIITQAEGKSHVITVEDPPEYTIFGWEPAKQTIISESQEEITDKKIKCYATQTPVMNVKDSAQKAEKFNLAISAAMRLDPEIIMIGEVRDAASAGAALQAAMTGHQVFTTVHANNALTIFPRLIDIGAKKELACDADVVCGLIAQRLTKKLCPHCCKSLLDNMDEFLKRQGAIATLKRLLVSFGAYKNYEEIKHIKDVNVMLEAIKDVDLSGVRIRNPEGCPNCNFNGLSGRSVVAEIIMTDQKYMELILQDKKAELKKILV
jgi:type II secretory ATPase GspE/PulE/Tfp pilus assembly ATPase PilB-like protein